MDAAHAPGIFFRSRNKWGWQAKISCGAAIPGSATGSSRVPGGDPVLPSAEVARFYLRPLVLQDRCTIVFRVVIATARACQVQAAEKRPSMERAPEGFEQLAGALLEMQQRMQALIAENRQLQEELAALRRGVGIVVVVEGQPFLLATGVTPSAPLRSPF